MPGCLLCLPWAGGVAGSYVAWRDQVRPTELVPIELPGRGRRYAERPLEHWSDAFAAVRRAVSACGGPIVLFGHSMGALFAYELARSLEKESRTPPAGLIVSAAAAPHRRRESLSSRMNDRELAVSLVGAGGTPHEILADPEFLAQYLSVLKSDLRVLESYRWRAGPAVRCPVFAIAGEQDTHAPPDAVEEWSRYMAGPFDFRAYPGGHFYFKSQLTAFLADLRTFLSRCEARVCVPSECA